MANAKRHDGLKLCRMDFSILRVELADKFPPCFKPVLLADESYNLRRLAEPLGEGPKVAVDGLVVRQLKWVQAGDVQWIILTARLGEAFPISSLSMVTHARNLSDHVLKDDTSFRSFG